MNKIKAIVIGASAGGLNAFRFLLEKLPADFKFPVLITQHVSPESDESWIRFLRKSTLVHIKEAEEKEPILGGYVYVAPPDYHMLVEYDQTIAFSKDEKVHYSRPSIDVLFESSADVYGHGLVGVLLTGANADGASGLDRIKRKGGIAIVQDPLEAESKEMPEAALKTFKPDYIFTLKEISDFLIKINSIR